jgi:hypothetical protein
LGTIFLVTKDPEIAVNKIDYVEYRLLYLLFVVGVMISGYTIVNLLLEPKINTIMTIVHFIKNYDEY